MTCTLNINWGNFPVICIHCRLIHSTLMIYYTSRWHRTHKQRNIIYLRDTRNIVIHIFVPNNRWINGRYVSLKSCGKIQVFEFRPGLHGTNQGWGCLNSGRWFLCYEDQWCHIIVRQVFKSPSCLINLWKKRSPVSCEDISQIWMWYPKDNRCFDNGENNGMDEFRLSTFTFYLGLAY